MKTTKKSTNSITLNELNNKLTETLAKAIEQEAAEVKPQPVPLTNCDKTAFMVHFLLREDGCTLKELAEALDWKENSVRGAMSLYAKKHKEYTLTSDKSQGTRIYRLTKAA